MKPFTKTEVPESAEVEEKTEDKQGTEPDVLDTSVSTPQDAGESDKGEEDGEKSDFSPRFTQFQAKDEGEYIQKLEGAYLNSTREGQNLAQTKKDLESQMDTVKNVIDSDASLKKAFAEKLYGDEEEDVDVDSFTPEKIKAVVGEVLEEKLNNIPALKRLDDEKEAKDRAVLQEFNKKHPEIADPTISQEFETVFGALAQADAAKGQPFNFEGTLNRAYKVVMADKETEDGKKMAEKDLAASSGTAASSNRPKAGSKLTQQQKDIATKLGLTEEQYREGLDLEEQANKI